MKPIDVRRNHSAFFAAAAASSLILLSACGDTAPSAPAPEAVNVTEEPTSEPSPEPTPEPSPAPPVEEVPEGLPEAAPSQPHSDALKAALSALSEAEKNRPNPFSSGQNGKGGEDYLELCAPCHGEAGRGDGPAAVALGNTPTNLVAVDEGNTLRPGEQFAVVENGIPGTHMQAFGMARSEAQIWQILAHIDSLR